MGTGNRTPFGVALRLWNILHKYIHWMPVILYFKDSLEDSFPKDFGRIIFLVVFVHHLYLMFYRLLCIFVIFIRMVSLLKELL